MKNIEPMGGLMDDRMERPTNKLDVLTETNLGWISDLIHPGDQFPVRREFSAPSDP